MHKFKKRKPSGFFSIRNTYKTAKIQVAFYIHKMYNYSFIKIKNRVRFESGFFGESEL